MKHISSILCYIFIGISLAFASDYKPLLENGKSWTIQYDNMLGEPSLYHSWGMGIPNYRRLLSVHVAGDTVIDGKQSWVIVKTPYGGNSEWTQNYILREEDRVVYIHSDFDCDFIGSPRFIPMLRFNVNVGDSIPLYDYFYDSITYEDFVEAIETVTDKNGTERLKFTATKPTYYNGKTDIWVEGIGFYNGFEFKTPHYLASSYPDHKMDFKTVECSLNGSTIFTYSDFNNEELAPEPKCEDFFTPGKSWTMAQGEETFTVSVEGDTYFEGIAAKKLRDSRGKEYVVLDKFGIIYIFPYELDQIWAMPVIDFSLKPDQKFYRHMMNLFGEPIDLVQLEDGTWDYSNRYECTVKSVKIINVNGIDRKEWIVENKAGEVVAYWVEAIGSPTAALWSREMPESYDLRMIDCRQDGNIIFTAEDFSNLGGISEVARRQTHSDYVYDLCGRRITNPRRGLYIINGKKQLFR